MTPVLWMILADFAAWLAIHLGTVWLANRVPDVWLERDHAMFRERRWEDGGRIYQRLLGIRRWKRLLPDGSSLFRGGFPKKRLGERTQAYYRAFIRESRRAELAHWVAIPPASLFFLWNPVGVGFVMIGYAVLVNLPCILAQRYNRPRFDRLAGRGAAVPDR